MGVPADDLRSLGKDQIFDVNRVRPITSGLAAGRPTVALIRPDSFYYETDTALLYYTNGTVWAQVTTTSGATLATTLPASPVDTQVAYLTDSLTAPTYTWQFRYTASITDSYKWVYIGGSPYRNQANAGTTINAATQVGATGYYYINGMRLLVPVAGVYEVTGWMDFFRNGGADGSVEAQVFSGTAVVGQISKGPIVGASSDQTSLPVGGYVTVTPAATALGICGSGSILGTYQLAYFNVMIRPIRVS